MRGGKAEELPLCALADDRVVEVQGDPRNVQRAMELVVSHLRKFLVDRSVLPLFELNVSFSLHILALIRVKVLHASNAREHCFGLNGGMASSDVRFHSTGMTYCLNSFI